MNYFSLNHNAPRVTFREAVIRGIAADKGLYFPESIPALPGAFFDNIENLSDTEIAYSAIAPFVGGEIPEDVLRRIIAETLSFDFPVIPIEDNVFSLELFHGPTMAFKDVGARFMARCLGYFNSGNAEAKNTVLVATSGDTGGAVASGFLGVAGVDVVILYPNGKVSDVQERQLTTLGQNIVALRVDGVFDDCQDMVKQAFLDEELSGLHLTSANSINIARWLPQMFYFFFAYKQLKKFKKPLVVSCPSGNFGNICAGILAKKLGLPILHFVAATNANDTVPRFLQNWDYAPKASVQTLSNAMDVGNPSNFVRIRELYNDDRVAFGNEFSSFSFSDAETIEAMKDVSKSSGYVLEPHGAVGYLGLKRVLKSDQIGVFLETAHPVKFAEIVEETLGFPQEIPNQIKVVLGKEKIFKSISSYEQLKQFLLNKK